MTCQLTVTATLTLPCARTWEDVEFPIEVETVEILAGLTKINEETMTETFTILTVKSST